MFEEGLKLLQKLTDNTKGGTKLTYPSTAKGKRIKRSRKGGQLAFALKLSCIGLSIFILYVLVSVISTISSQIRHSNQIGEGAGGIQNLTVRAALQTEKTLLLTKEKTMIQKAKTLLLGKNSVYRVEGIEDPMGKKSNMAQYNGMITVIVNVGCKLKELDIMWEPLFALQDKYKKDGLIVIAFPLDDYLKGSANMYDYELQRYMRQTFAIEKGEDGSAVEQPGKALAHYLNLKIYAIDSVENSPLYQTLSTAPDQLPDDKLDGNFNMYLVDRRGMGVKLYHSNSKQPELMTEQISKDIDALLISSPLKANKKFDEELYEPFHYF